MPFDLTPMTCTTLDDAEEEGPAAACSLVGETLLLAISALLSDGLDVTAVGSL